MIVIVGEKKFEEKSEKENKKSKKSFRRFDENENDNVNDKTYFTPQIFYHLNSLKGYSKVANNKSISLPELITVSICIQIT